MVTLIVPMWFDLPIELRQSIYMYAVESPFVLHPGLRVELLVEIRRRKSFAYRVYQAKRAYRFLCKRHGEDKMKKYLKGK